MNDDSISSSARSSAGFVGRVGALAVLFGVGAAVAGLSGVACADAPDSDRSAGGAGTSSSSPSSSGGTDHPTRRGPRSAVTSPETSGHPESGWPGRRGTAGAAVAASVARPASSTPSAAGHQSAVIPLPDAALALSPKPAAASTLPTPVTAVSADGPARISPLGVDNRVASGPLRHGNSDPSAAKAAVVVTDAPSAGETAGTAHPLSGLPLTASTVSTSPHPGPAFALPAAAEAGPSALPVAGAAVAQLTGKMCGGCLRPPTTLTPVQDIVRHLLTAFGLAPGGVPVDNPGVAAMLAWSRRADNAFFAAAPTTAPAQNGAGSVVVRGALGALSQTGDRQLPDPRARWHRGRV